MQFGHCCTVYLLSSSVNVLPFTVCVLYELIWWQIHFSVGINTMLLSNLKSDILAVIILEQKKQPANKHLPQTSC